MPTTNHLAMIRHCGSGAKSCCILYIKFVTKPREIEQVEIKPKNSQAADWPAVERSKLEQLRRRRRRFAATAAAAGCQVAIDRGR